MKEKLTLTISKETKNRTKRYAQRQEASVSKIVEAYLNSISATEEDPVKYLGWSPVRTGVPDASKNHDQYTYTLDK